MNCYTCLAVDTNVFVHSHNEAVTFHHASKAFLNTLLISDVLLLVDEGFDSNPARNSSRISHEYIEFISHGSFGFYALLRIATEGRILEVERKQFTPLKQRFQQLVRDKTDIFFLSVAASSDDQTLVSNDYKDFQKAKRRKWKKTDLVLVLDAEEIMRQQEN